MDWGFKSQYTEADIRSALVYLSDKEEFSPIAYWIDNLREKTIRESRQSTVVKDATLMAVQMGRLSAFDEIRSVILSYKRPVIAPTEVVSNTEDNNSLSPEAMAYAQANGIIPMPEGKPTE